MPLCDALLVIWPILGRNFAKFLCHESLKVCKLMLQLICFKCFYFVCLGFRFVYEMALCRICLSRICTCLGIVLSMICPVEDLSCRFGPVGLVLSDWSV